MNDGVRNGALRVVFCGSSPEAAEYLDLLHRAGVAVTKVYTAASRATVRGKTVQGSAVAAAALRHGIPLATERLDAAEVQTLRGAAPDLLVTVAYGKILPDAVLEIPMRGVINVHPSLLPRHRGPSPVEAALLAGDESTGVTFMLTERKVDAGPVLYQSPPVPIGASATKTELKRALFQLGQSYLLRVIDDWTAGKLTPTPQDEAEATYSRILTKADGRVDWHSSADYIERMVRAYSDWPSTYTDWAGRQLKLLSVTPVTEPAAPPGRVTIQGSALFIGCGVGTLRIDRLQLAGSKAQDSREFINGHPAIDGYTFCKGDR